MQKTRDIIMNEVSRLRSNTTRQKSKVDSDVKIVMDFYNLCKRHGLEEIDSDSKLNLGFVSNALIVKVLTGKTLKVEHQKEMIYNINGTRYQLGSVVISKPATIKKSSTNKPYKNLLYLVYTATMHGIYKIPLTNDLIGCKLSASKILELGTLVVGL